MSISVTYHSGKGAYQVDHKGVAWLHFKPMRAIRQLEQHMTSTLAKEVIVQCKVDAGHAKTGRSSIVVTPRRLRSRA